MRKEVPRDSAANPKLRPAAKPSPTVKGLKRAAPVAGKTDVKKKKPPVKQGEEEAKKKLLKPKVVLTKLPAGALQHAKLKPVKEVKKETSPKPVKPKPKKVIVSKATKKDIKPENAQKKASTAKIVQAVKNLKNAKSVVASKMKRESNKKLSNSTTIKKIPGGSINLVKKHNIVKRVNKMSGKKPCVVSVKISNAHSTVTLSVKQNKQVNKKDCAKGIKSGSGKSPDRNTISIVKKGIASRRKSTSKDSSFQDSSPSSSPIRGNSPIRIKEEKNVSQIKKSDCVKTQKKASKQSSIEANKCSDEKSKDKGYASKATQEENISGKTEVFINDSVKIKTENVGEDQNMEIEFTNDSSKDQSSDRGNDGKDKCKLDGSVFDFKSKASSNEYSNLKSIDSSTSDEIPLEILKCKQKIKQEKDSNKSYEFSTYPKTKKEKDSLKSENSENKKKVGSSKLSTENKKSDIKINPKNKTPERMSKATLRKLDQESITNLKCSKKKNIALKQKIAKLVKNSRLNEQKHSKTQDKDDSSKSSGSDNSGRKRKKLLKFWNGPKRHRVASLNAIAKVHCLYENESRGALNEMMSSAAALQRAIQESKKMAGIANTKSKPKKPDSKNKKAVCKKLTAKEKRLAEPAVVRNLRTNPGVRSVGRNFDILNVISSTSLSSSSSEDSSDSGEEKKQLALLPTMKQKQLQVKKEQESEQTSDDEECKKLTATQEDSKEGIKKIKKRRRKRNELTMDLKDMVVRKRMASLNASAIMTATYSSEKKLENVKLEQKKDEEFAAKKERKKKKKQPSSPKDAEDSSGEEDDLMVRTTNNKQKVAVIVNQDTDVTITGVYVNSTTRSTHHEGYCSIAGMQYRISSTSHTQTEATAVATETVLHTDHPPCLPEPVVAPPSAALASPCKSYTPLSALSSMQPPGPRHAAPCQPPLDPLQRRHCSSAFSAPPGQHPPPPPHPDVHGNYRWDIGMTCCGIQPSRLCYYQPAGPLISTHHHHHHAASKVPPAPTPASLPAPTPPPASVPAPASDTEVVLTTSADNPPVSYHRYPPYNYGYNYYPTPAQYPPPGQQSHYHQEVCYSAPSGYPPGYFPKGHYPPGYPRRYAPPPHQYYPPQEFYPNPSSNPPPSSNSQMMVTAPPTPGQTSSSYPPADGNYPPPTTMVEPYPPPPPQPYYPGYSAGPPPPACYSTHSPSSRGLFLDPAYQSCPCPMQSCPKNVHTGPLTGASKGSMKNHQTLPPVALALPLEPPGALGPPSPARGSAGMPPPPSPALATARNPPQSPPTKPLSDQIGLLAIGRAVTDAVLLADHGDTMLAELMPRAEAIKQELEDIIKTEALEEVKCNRKRRKSLKNILDVKKQALEVISDTEMKVEVQERLITPKEEPDKTLISDIDSAVDKQLPLSDNRVIVKSNCVTSILNGMTKDQPKKRKSESSDCEPAAKVAKCAKSPKVQNNKKCIKRNKCVAEENIAPESEPVAVEVVDRRNSKLGGRRKSSCSPHVTTPPEETTLTDEESDAGKKKKVARAKKAQEKTKADHLLRSHGKTEVSAAVTKERRLSKSGCVKSDVSPTRGKKAVLVAEAAGNGAVAPLDPSAESSISLPGLRRNPTPKWSNGWAWEGAPYKAKIFLNIDDGEVVRTCYPAMRHAQGDTICPRDCILLKSGPRKTDLPFVAKVAAMWENPDDGEMMVSLLWYYRPEHTEQGRRSEDIPDEIFASRHKDTNSVACIEDKCFVLTFSEYCRYRKTVRRLEEGLSQKGTLVPPPDGGSYPRTHRQPPGRVAPDLVFFCRRVYDFRQKRILKNPC